MISSTHNGLCCKSTRLETWWNLKVEAWKWIQMTVQISFLKCVATSGVRQRKKWPHSHCAPALRDSRALSVHQMLSFHGCPAHAWHDNCSASAYLVINLPLLLFPKWFVITFDLSWLLLKLAFFSWKAIYTSKPLDEFHEMVLQQFKLNHKSWGLFILSRGCMMR